MYHFDGTRIILDGIVIWFDSLEVSLSVVVLQTTSNKEFMFNFPIFQWSDERNV